MELSHVYDQEAPWPRCEEIEVGGMSQNASVIESENVEKESDEEDQEARDQTEEQTQVEDQVEERTLQARELHSRRRQRNTETGRSERVEDRENISAARL